MGTAFSNVYWIGGSPCSGKSSIADNLAAKHGLAVYRCDEAFYRHQKLVTPEAQPVFSRLARASCDGLWMRPVPLQVTEEVALYHEEFPLILDDLADLSEIRPVIAERSALLPDLIGRLGVRRRRLIWIVPTAEFQRTHYSLRAWRHDVLTDCTDKEQAWHNWMERDAGFARVAAGQAGELDYRVLTVDGGDSIEDNTRAVEAWFGFL
jgi:hypothetical protein